MEYFASKTIPRLTRQADLFAWTGSFWTSVFGQPREARSLVWTGQMTGLWENWQATIGLLAQDWNEGGRVECQTIPFAPSSVFFTGANFYDGPPSAIYGTDDQSSRLIYSKGPDVAYALPYEGVLPYVLQGDGVRLSLGIDFFWQPPGYLIFKKDPNILFPRHALPILSGWDPLFRSPWSPLWRLNQSGQDKYAIEYFRVSSTPGNYVLALAAALDLGIVEEEQILLSAHVRYNETTYLFEKQVVRVDYHHEPLVLGQTYPKGYIIGEGLKILQGDPRSESWWRKVDWHGGLYLSPILPAATRLWLPDELVPVYPVGDDPPAPRTLYDKDGRPIGKDGSRTHIRCELRGDDEQAEVYWRGVALRESRTGQYLNSLAKLGADEGHYLQLLKDNEQLNDDLQAAGLPTQTPDVSSLLEARQINALNFFFLSGVGAQCLVLLIDYRYIKNQERLNQFLDQEPPGSGGSPIILAYGPTLNAVPANLNAPLENPGMVAIQPANLVVWTAKRAFDLSTMVKTKVVIRSFSPFDLS